MTEIHGTCDPRFEAVRTTFANNFDAGYDVGASVAVYVDGEPVVDLWGGFADRDQTKPWERDTIINVWSTTKTMTFVAALMLADQGLIGIDEPVARYWPEFAANGKENVLVRHLMAHTAGLSGWQEKLSGEDLYDWEKCTSLLAAQAPWWEPGTASGYHAITQGYLIGEVVRRVTGQNFGTFFRNEIAEPRGADFPVGFGPELDDRVALVITPPAPPRPEVFPPFLVKTMTNPMLNAKQSWDLDWRRAEIPAAGGHGNARSVALAQCAVSAGGSARGVDLLSAETVERIFDVQAAGRDLVLGIGVTFGVGYGLNSPRAPISPNARVCYWGGWGGSLVVNDVDAGLTMAYVMNRMGEGTVGDDRAHTILRGCYQSLGI